MLFFWIYDKNNEIIAEKPFPNSGVTRRVRTRGRLEFDARRQYVLLVLTCIRKPASKAPTWHRQQCSILIGFTAVTSQGTVCLVMHAVIRFNLQNIHVSG